MDALGAWYLLLVGVFLPYVVLKSSYRLRAGAPIPPRNKQLTAALVVQLFLLLLGVYTARREWIELFARGRLSAAALLTAVALLALGLGTLPLRQRLSSAESNRRQMQTRPAKPSDLGPWLVVSLMAGFTEEIVYRGVMFTLLYRLTGSWWIAALLTVLVFSVSHATQGLPRAVFVGILAFGLHVLVWLTGALLLSMIVHFLYDFFAGVIYVRLARSLEAAPQAGSQPA